MVFSSIPAYLDSSNWQQQQNPQSGGINGNPQLQVPPQLSQPQVGTGGGPGSIRPGSMADRARMANVAMPETALKCPRCESTNTKFCYFNNYSLSQPRHFCKTCRRYWTRGGALRSVPVGGGCRRNKRSKGGNTGSKSEGGGGGGDNRQTSSGSTSAVSSSTSAGTMTLLGLSPQIPPLPFMGMSPLSQLSEYGISAPFRDMNFQLGNSSLGVGGYVQAGAGGGEQWRLQPPQMSSLASGLDFQSAGLYPFQGGYVGEGSRAGPKPSDLGLTHDHQIGSSVKMEDSHHQGLNLSRQFLAVQGNHDHHQYWSGGGNSAWTDLSGFNTSNSSTNPCL